MSPMGSDYYRPDVKLVDSNIFSDLQTPSNPINQNQDQTPSSAMMNDFQQMLTQGQGSIFGGGGFRQVQNTAPSMSDGRNLVQSL